MPQRAAVGHKLARNHFSPSKPCFSGRPTDYRAHGVLSCRRTMWTSTRRRSYTETLHMERPGSWPFQLMYSIFFSVRAATDDDLLSPEQLAANASC